MSPPGLGARLAWAVPSVAGLVLMMPPVKVVVEENDAS